MVKRRLIIAVVVPLAIGAFIAFFGYFMGRHYAPLARRGTQTTGRVIAKEPMNHRSVRYEFLVGTKRYSGIGEVVDAFDQINTGDSVPVTYLPDRPSVSVLGGAVGLYRSWVHFLLLVPTSIALIPMVLAVSVEFARSHLTSR